jgi:hypothetical protein
MEGDQLYKRGTSLGEGAESHGTVSTVWIITKSWISEDLLVMFNQEYQGE